VVSPLTENSTFRRLPANRVSPKCSGRSGRACPPTGRSCSRAGIAASPSLVVMRTGAGAARVRSAVVALAATAASAVWVDSATAIRRTAALAGTWTV
jgi:hypothetical protein